MWGAHMVDRLRNELTGHSTNAQPCLTANELCGQEVPQSEGPITAEESLGESCTKGLNVLTSHFRRAGSP